jgi:hypothetical protein
MSRYQLDKFIKYSDDSGDRIAAFAADPAAYVAAWHQRGETAHPRPVADGGLLNEAERRAFATEDYGTLYALGAHPYALFHFVVAVDLVRGPRPWPEFVEWYREFVTPHGRPDFAT